MHALSKSDYAILTYILHIFAFCRRPKGGHGTMAPPKYAPGCACLSVHITLVTA